jgi:hypothetical protein
LTLRSEYLSVLLSDSFANTTLPIGGAIFGGVNHKAGNNDPSDEFHGEENEKTEDSPVNSGTTPSFRAFVPRLENIRCSFNGKEDRL